MKPLLAVFIVALMPLFRHPIVLAPPDTSASTAGVPVSWSTPGPVFDDRHNPIYATRGS